MKHLVLGFLFLFSTVNHVSAAEITQTDWSAGPGILSPVTNWEADFQTSSGISWQSIPGQVALSGTPELNWTKNTLTNSYNSPFGVAAGDMDGDGDMDIVGTAEMSGVICMWINNGTSPATWTEQVVSNRLNGATGLSLTDLDSDGDLDILASATGTSNKIAWWRNDGGQPLTWTYQIIQSSWFDSYEVHAEDVDGDGHVDVLSTMWNPGYVTWWRNNGSTSPTWSRRDVAVNFAGAHSVRTGDLDDDGDMDLVAAGADCDEIAYWINDGESTPTWTKNVLRTGFNGARSVRVTDLDHDGDLDIVGISWASHVAWWRNDGGDPLVWTEQIIDGQFAGGHGLDVADVDGDGKLDVIGASYVRNRVTWWQQGEGDPIVWIPHYFLPGVPHAMEVATGDFDNDGDLDIIASANSAREFVWFEVTQFAPTGELNSSVLDLGTSTFSEIDWTASGLESCEVQVSVRSGSEPDNLGFWSAPMSTPGPLPSNQGQYFQYRVELSSTDPACSPILTDLTLRANMSAVSPTKLDPFRLEVFPNPSNPATIVKYQTPGEVPVSILVHDLSGRLVQTLYSGSPSVGNHQVRWEGKDNNGQSVSTGIYMVQLKVGDNDESRKLTLLR